jgi:hypothetical protein
LQGRLITLAKAAHIGLDIGLERSVGGGDTNVEMGFGRQDPLQAEGQYQQQPKQSLDNSHGAKC